jgi:hypothetical protein
MQESGEQIGQSKIILMTEASLDAEAVEKLIAEIKETEPGIEIQQLELVRKTVALAVQEVIIFIAKAAGTLVVHQVLKAAVKWAKERIEFEGDFKQSKYIVIFGADGIPLAARQVLNTQEVIELPTEHRRAPPLPPHLL